MTVPNFTDSDDPSTATGGTKRDPNEFLNWDRICEMVTPRGTRPGKLIIVRPLDKVRDWREKDPSMDWKTLVIADIAVLEAIDAAADKYGMPLPAFPPGSQWRNQVVFPGMLNKAWREQIGNTLIGVVYLGVNEKGQPPYLWRSLAKLEAAKQRGRSFMIARPEFLIPIARDPQVAAQAESWAAGPVTGGPHQYQEYQQGYGQVASNDPWASATPAAQYQQQPAQSHAAPVSSPPQGHYQQQPDPWAAHPAAPVSPAATHPQQGMSTIDQLKLAAQQANHQGGQQPTDPPF